MITVLKVQTRDRKTHLNDCFSDSIVRKASRHNAHLAFTGIDYVYLTYNDDSRDDFALFIYSFRRSCSLFQNSKAEEGSREINATLQ